MDSVRRSQSSDVLTEAEEVSGFLLELAHFFREWRFTLPDVLTLLQVFHSSYENKLLNSKRQKAPRLRLEAPVGFYLGLTLKHIITHSYGDFGGTPRR